MYINYAIHICYMKLFWKQVQKYSAHLLSKNRATLKYQVSCKIIKWDLITIEENVWISVFISLAVQFYLRSFPD